MSLAEALEVRRTVRRFASRPPDLAQVSQLLWGAGDTSGPRGLAVRRGHLPPGPLSGGEGAGGKDLPAGIYHYRAEAPVMVVITGEYRRCTARYGERGVRYTHMEAGNVSQNLFLTAEVRAAHDFLYGLGTIYIIN